MLETKLQHIMMDHPLVSIIIPSFNAALTILDTINSCLAQTWQNLEVIVVDDGSKDDTINIVDKILDKRIIVVKQENKGGGAARNLGLSLANGEYIQFLDADDLISPDKIEKQLEFYVDSKNKNVIIGGKWARFYTCDCNSEELHWQPEYEFNVIYTPIEWLISNKMMACHAWLTPKNLIQSAGGWDESLRANQDGEFFSRVIAEADAVIICPEAKAYYRSNVTNSITSNLNSRASLESRFKACKSLEQVVLKLDDSKSAKAFCIYNYYKFLYHIPKGNSDLTKQVYERIIALDVSEYVLDKQVGSKLFYKLQKIIGFNNALKFRDLIKTLKI